MVPRTPSTGSRRKETTYASSVHPTKPRSHPNPHFQMNEGTFSPPSYNDLYNFRDGPQDDIFENSYDSIPVPSPNQTAIPQLKNSPNSGVPVLPSSFSGVPSSSISSTVTPPTISPSTSPCSLDSSSTPNPAYPTSSPSSSSPPIPSLPPVTVTNTVFVTVFPGDPLPTFSGSPSLSSSTATPVPSPGDPGVIVLGRRKPM